MSEVGGLRTGRSGESRATALRGRASVWRLQGLHHTTASQLDLGEGQPDPLYLFSTLWLETHPNSFIILLSCANLAAREEDPITPVVHHPWVSDPLLALMGREGDMKITNPTRPQCQIPISCFFLVGLHFQTIKRFTVARDIKFERRVESQDGNLGTG